jgi:hypothetical protein
VTRTKKTWDELFDFRELYGLSVAVNQLVYMENIQQAVS